MNKIIKMLVCIASLTLGIIEDAPGDAVEDVKEKVRSWAEEGKKAGLKIAALLAKGESVMQETLLKFASKVAGQPAAEDWLTGYASAFEVDQTKKNRKSEAKAIFAAWASNHDYKRVDTSTEDNLKLARAGTPVHTTKTCREWLSEYTGGYHAFVQLARDMDPKVTDASTKTGTERVKTLTEKGAKKVIEALATATGAQADQVMGASIKQLKKMPGFETKILGHIVGLCNELKLASHDVRMLDAASAIIDVVAATTSKMPGTGAVTAPAPAVSAVAVESIPAVEQVQKAA